MIKPGLIIAIPSFTNSRIRPSHDLNQRRSYYVTYRESKVQHYTIIFHLFCCNLWERMSLFQRKVFKTSVILMVICLCGIATSNNEVHFTKLKTVVNVIFFFTSNGWIVYESDFNLQSNDGFLMETMTVNSDCSKEFLYNKVGHSPSFDGNLSPFDGRNWLFGTPNSLRT